ncbi:MAG TPA: L-aspartate oxidase, partial [Verrucomicrobiae bacterium]|nr:L-aspartate oxidase [Verrucomicrobiae bacterium]
MQVIDTEYLVIGSGVAGLATALWAAPHGEVTVLCKQEPNTCNTSLAQGGIAAAVGTGDSPQLHSRDTLLAGAGVCSPEAVKILTSQGPDIIRALLDWGVEFDREENGSLGLAREGAHSLARVLHHGDDTGAEIWRALYRAAAQTPGINILSNTFVAELLQQNNRCHGVVVHMQDGSHVINAQAVILATGGCGQVYGKTTNSLTSTGDGLALAMRAGAAVADLEFIQFHPTALNTPAQPLFLISEAVRGEGAKLVNSNGDYFMGTYHAMADLAPRDVVSRAILGELSQNRQVYLDARSLAAFTRRFPNIYRTCLKHNLDPCLNLIPVTPAAHFMIGGVKTDIFGRTSVEGLYAVGEVASTGVHGANRLASNSLLEGMVFGKRAAMSLAKLPKHSISQPAYPRQPESFIALNFTDVRLRELQAIMWEKVGILRSGQSLLEAETQFLRLEEKVSPGEFELRNMIQVARAIT